MANYMATARTNYFRVTDEDRYQDLFSGLVAEDDIHDFTETGEDGVIRHGFGTYGWMSFEEDEDGGDTGMDSFFEELKEILPDDEAFIYTEVGNEKLRYVVGYSAVVTNKEVKYLDLTNLAIDTASKMLGVAEFKTQMDY